jgi:hypothetical protein
MPVYSERYPGSSAVPLSPSRVSAWIPEPIEFVVPVAAFILVNVHLGGEGAWPVLAGAWLIARVAGVLLMPAGSPRLALIPSAVFLAGHLVARLVIDERFEMFREFHGSSDDYGYLTLGARIAEALGRDFSLQSISATIPIDTPHPGHYTVLGLLFTLVPEQLQCHYCAAVSLNLLALSLMFALLVRCARSQASVSDSTICLVLAMLAPELLVFCAEARKDTVILLLLVTVYACSSERRGVLRLICGGAALWALYYYRRIYVPVALLAVPLAASPLRGWQGRALRFLIAFTAVAGIAWMLFGSRSVVGHYSDSATGNLRLGSGEIAVATGLSGFIYTLPLVGPPLYFLLTPSPFGVSSFTYEGLRSLGTICTVLLFGYSVIHCRQGYRNGGRYYLYSAALFAALFLMAAYGATEARHKDPALPFLALLALYTATRQQGGIQQRSSRALADLQVSDQALPWTTHETCGRRVHEKRMV